MPCDVNAPPRAAFLQTPEALIDDCSLTDAALRLLQAMVKLPPRNARNSDAVARTLRMGKEKTNAARKSLRLLGHWHARKRQNGRGEIRDQRMASLVPLRTPDALAAAWAAAEEAARLGKDTAASRRWGVRILNSREWQADGRSAAATARVGAARTAPTPRMTPEPSASPPLLARRPAAGRTAAPPTRRRPPEGSQIEENQTPLPLPAATGSVSVPAAAAPDASAPRPFAPRPSASRPPGFGQDPSAPDAADPRTPLTQLPALTGVFARYAEHAECVLRSLQHSDPQLALPSDKLPELAQLAGQYLLRGRRPEAIRLAVAQGLPAEGVRCPAAFVRQRLLRYLPPIPAWSLPDRPAPTSPPRPRTGPDEPLVRPDGPADLIRQGHGWRAALRVAADQHDRRRPQGDTASPARQAPHEETTASPPEP
ncbi:hypothetical protein QNO07_18760 [Streptomyces sp. 549]|uniref:hypothetical protein n=1 Tax=Streptomyces sp. 549 TaxID=3049076 RepID=UPI0024C42B8F|nr:hypothetical protein [Streptomyces sp. 549]MDK1475434.1 hypothetical protein [Streptomyces sp. 549]